PWAAVLMVLDTSAIIASITNEQDSLRFRAAMLGAESLLMSSVAALETRMVLLARLGPGAVGLFEELLEIEWNCRGGVRRRNGEGCLRGVSPFRQGPGSSGSVEHRRLRGLCTGQSAFAAPPLQG